MGVNVELQELAERFAAGMTELDSMESEVRFSPRTGEAYLPGVKSMTESGLVAALDTWLGDEHPDAFASANAHATGVPYPTLARTKCDFVFSSVEPINPPEWAVEVKNVTLIGNNGKRNDFAVAKVLSPFLKDRSLLHDVLRLREYPLARRHAALGYAFSYDLETCIEARSRHPQYSEQIAEIENVVRTNGNALTVDPLLNFADGIMRVRNLITGPLVRVPFEAWRHPCGGHGVIFGWEVRRPHEDGTFDPRHPW